MLLNEGYYVCESISKELLLYVSDISRMIICLYVLFVSINRILSVLLQIDNDAIYIYSDKESLWIEECLLFIRLQYC